MLIIVDLMYCTQDIWKRIQRVGLIVGRHWLGSTEVNARQQREV